MLYHKKSLILQVTFGDPESAKRACADPNPVIDGRRANCNIASLRRPHPSPPRGTFYVFVYFDCLIAINILGEFNIYNLFSHNHINTHVYIYK